LSAGLLTVKTKLAFGIGATGEAATNWIFSGITFFFYNQVLGLSGSLTGFAVLIAIIFDAVSDPIMGSISDRFKSKLGRRHPFMFFAPFPTVLAICLMFFPPEGLSDYGLFAWLIGTTVVLRISITLFAVPHLALGAELSEDYIERSRVMSYNNLLGYTGVIIMHIFAWFLVFPNFAGEEIGQLNQAAYTPIVIFSTILIALCILSSAYFTKDRIPYLKKPSDDASKIGILDLFQDIAGALGNRNYLRLVAGMFFLTLLIGTHETLAIYMGTFFWELSPQQIGLLVINNILGFAFGFIVTARLHQRFDKPVIMVVSIIMLSVFWSASVNLRLLGLAPENSSTELVLFIIFFGSITSAGGSILNITVMSALADIADEHELNTGIRQEGVFYAARTLFAKTSSGIGHVVAGLALDFIAFPTDSAPGEIPSEIIFQLGLIDGPFAMIWGLIGAFFYARYKITKQSHAKIKAALAIKNL
jgi:glycoside/pentoside/hexuronide:cation symporter, GPH family